MKRALILGAGHVTKPLVDYFIDKCGYQVTMATRTVSKANKVLARRSHGEGVAWKSDDEDLLQKLVADHDIVVNMIPKAYHVNVARACLEHRKPMVTTSYEIPPIKALDAEAKERGVLILNELGEDPGIDHFVTQMILDEVRAEGGKVVSLHSFGSGLPSFAFNNNPLGYKFSWEPKGVFLAAQVPAVHLKQGRAVFVDGNKLFDNHWMVDIAGLGTFETYPNKDVRKYVKHFSLPEDVTFYRGLLRFSGYCNNMRAFIKLGLLNDQDKFEFKHKTYREFAASLVENAKPETVEQDVAQFLNADMKSDIMNRLSWLGLFSDQPIGMKGGSRLDAFVALMLKKMSYAPGETDMTLIHVEVVADFSGKKEKRMATMVHHGTPYGDSAMARCVALPAAIAARLILEGVIKATGVQMPPTLPELYRPILAELEEYDIRLTRSTVKL